MDFRFNLICLTIDGYLGFRANIGSYTYTYIKTTEVCHVFSRPKHEGLFTLTNIYNIEDVMLDEYLSDFTISFYDSFEPNTRFSHKIKWASVTDLTAEGRAKVMELNTQHMYKFVTDSLVLEKEEF